MGTWNYRIMRNKCEAGYHFAIHEVYYDEKTRKVNGWTTDGVGPSGETLEELRSDMKFIQSALRKPVLSYQTGKPIKLSGAKKSGHSVHDCALLAACAAAERRAKEGR